MASYTQQAGGIRRVRLDVPVRAFWSRTRSWHGEPISMHVETAYLPDHTPLRVRVLEACEPPDSDRTIDSIDTGLKLVNNRASIAYKIAWNEALGRAAPLKSDRCEFVFEVRIDAPRVRARSNVLYVHLHPHRVSG
jgi:hypothetical protein